VLSGGALGVAGRRRFEALAWLAALGGAATAVAIVPFGARIAPSALYLVLLGVGTLWLGYVRDWRYLRWPIAAAANLTALALVFRAVRPQSPEGPGTLLVVGLALLALYLGSIAARTLVLNRAIVPFEAVQGALVVAIALGGCAFVTARSGSGATALGAGSVALGLAAYALAFSFLERSPHRVNFRFYGSLGAVFVLGGVALALPQGTVAIAFGVLAAGVAALARRTGRLTLAAHAAAYGIAAVASADLLAAAARVTFSPPPAWAPNTAVGLAALALAAVATWLLAACNRRTNVERLPQLLLLAAVAISAEGMVLAAILPRLAGGTAIDLGAVATVRTAVLVAATFALAWIGRADAWHEARWLVYPLLAATGLKLLLEDVSRSRPATLFLAFAVYGAALILVPRLRRRDEAGPARPASRAA
jgi:hypothetical protein